MLIVEIDGPRNECLHFRPLQRQIRGRLDLMRAAEPMAKVRAAEEPVIPGQRLGYDADRRLGFIFEPLYDEEFRAVRERIERKGFRLGPQREEFPDADPSTWQYWIGRAVEDGVAKVIEGKLPRTLPGEPRRNFVFAEPERPRDRLADAIEAQTRVMQALLQKLGATA